MDITDEGQIRDAAHSVDTLDVPKASPEAVAKGIFDGVENDEDEIFPDPLSQALPKRSPPIRK